MRGSNNHETAGAVPIASERSAITASLHRAVREDSYEDVLRCLANGADATSYNEDGYTPIGTVARFKCQDALGAFRSFYYNSNNAQDLLDLLRQPQGVAEGRPSQFANFNRVVKDHPELYREGTFVKEFFLAFKSEVKARAEFDGSGRDDEFDRPDSPASSVSSASSVDIAPAGRNAGGGRIIP